MPTGCGPRAATASRSSCAARRRGSAPTDQVGLAAFASVAVDDVTGRAHAAGAGQLATLRDGRWEVDDLDVLHTEELAVSRNRRAVLERGDVIAIEPDGSTNPAGELGGDDAWRFLTVAARDGVLYAGGFHADHEPLLVENRGASWRRIPVPGVDVASIEQIWAGREGHLWVVLRRSIERSSVVLERAKGSWSEVPMNAKVFRVAPTPEGELLGVVDGSGVTGELDGEIQVSGEGYLDGLNHVLGVAPLADGRVVATTQGESRWEGSRRVATFGLHVQDGDGDWTTLASMEIEPWEPSRLPVARGHLATDGLTTVAAAGPGSVFVYACEPAD